MTPAQGLQRRADGFLERGHQVTRLESFVDASFAFAVTLLVISVNELPDNPESLVTALKRIPAFAGSFAAIAMFWYQHNVWSRRFGLDDTRSILLSLLLVFMVLVYVYPLRILFAAFFAWISGGFFPSDFRIQSLEDLKTMFSVYALAFGSIGIVIAAHEMNALRLRAQIGLDALEVLLLKREVLASFVMPFAAIVSLLTIAAVDESWPRWAYGMPGMVYCLMGLTGLVQRYRAAEVRELRAALAAA